MERQLRFVREVGEWSCRLGCSTTASVGDGKSASRVTGAWGASLANGSSATSHPRYSGCLLRLFSKPASEGALVDLWLAALGFQRWPAAMESGGFGLQGSKNWLVIS